MVLLYKQALKISLFALFNKLGTLKDVEREALLDALSTFFRAGNCPEGLYQQVLDKLVSNEQVFFIADFTHTIIEIFI